MKPIPTLPEGYVFLGAGNSFYRPDDCRQFEGLFFNPNLDACYNTKWTASSYLVGDDPSWVYAVPLDSIIARTRNPYYYKGDTIRVFSKHNKRGRLIVVGSFNPDGSITDSKGKPVKATATQLVERASDHFTNVIF